MANSLEKVFAKDYRENMSYVDTYRNLFESNRDFMTKELLKMDLPFKPLECEGGYFLMVDIADCKKFIPSKYLETHDYQAPEHGTKTAAHHLYMPDGSIPLDLAFCRWMACEKGVVLMPNSFFYQSGSPNLTDNIVRMAICKERPGIQTAFERLKQIKL